MIELKSDTTLAAAWTQRWRREFEARPLRVFEDEYHGALYLFGHEHGPAMLIRARNWSSAWEIAIDESPTIPESELPEAYGIYGQPLDLALKHLQAQDELAREGCSDYPELVEGYEYQSNMSGTGIVDVGHYAWLREATSEDFAPRGQIGLRIERID